MEGMMASKQAWPQCGARLVVMSLRLLARSHRRRRSCPRSRRAPWGARLAWRMLTSLPCIGARVKTPYQGIVVRLYIHIYIHIHIHTYVYIHIHIYIYILYIHLRTSPLILYSLGPFQEGSYQRPLQAVYSPYTDS